MNQHLIAIDLDGTTLNNDAQLSPTTIKTIKAASKAGHIVSIVTGRPYRISQRYYDSLGLKSPMVNFNGALAHIPHEEWHQEYQKNINREIALDLLTHKDELGIDTMTAENKLHLWANRQSNVMADFFPTKLNPNEVLNSNNLTSDPTALTVEYKPGEKDTLIKNIQDNYGSDVDIRVWGGPHNILEVVSKGIQKAMGVSYLAKTYNIDQSNIIAFGDEENDAEMIKYAGRGVAMKNAIPSITALADDQTEVDNQHDGLAHYLNDYLKLDI
ncbi:HAD superfamily hydrolase [Paucilactobacillus oligofermentans DSM 15707 = LMG 22743]|uniref:HAD superfamily hydrolase n=1 Tax=Paucilactobacillus oligofermentans DSM 15707 = LMG 22743 TaxID=1423778 RepID=A0A0R1RI26_9LACO|nr:Cof-type HAD-IIB family hydrolase [Paucilactobacillus oligofermentans]KRL54884.1 HAD superfamily hydrolase [Paucilactobacillus oligofermentans DSM 15707 = LMG 22743]CUS26201.1 Cof family protein [Paucilactobacillus oligofermentans DSM 15707 = LMG 22743]